MLVQRGVKEKMQHLVQVGNDNEADYPVIQISKRVPIRSEHKDSKSGLV